MNYMKQVVDSTTASQNNSGIREAEILSLKALNKQAFRSSAFRQ